MRVTAGEGGESFHRSKHTRPYLSSDAQRLEGVSSTGHDLRLVHQQDSDVVLTFNLQTNEEKLSVSESTES